MLIVTTDRLSAFDVVLPDPIPDKGRVLNEISNFWFERTRHIVPNHLTGRPLDSAVKDADERALLEGRAVIVRTLEALPLEAVVRGYLIGSGWKDYQKTGAVCGIALPPGLRLAEKLAAAAVHAGHEGGDGRARREHLVRASGTRGRRHRWLPKCGTPRSRSITSPPSMRAQRGIIIADTKFEFGVDAQGQLTLIDEVLTPDSSRFWPADTYSPGTSPPSFDKQFVRDYLETLDWNKAPPAPKLPPEIIARTSEKYREALARLTR